MNPPLCNTSDTLMQLEGILSDINISDAAGTIHPELVIGAAVLLGTLQKWPKETFTDEEVEYILDSGKYLSDYTRRMNKEN